MLIPGIFTVLEKIVGPVLEVVKPSLGSNIIASLMSGKGVRGVISAIEGSLGKLDDIKKAQLEAELQTMLGNIEVDKIEATSKSRFDSGWRPYLAWGVSTALLMSILLEPTIRWVMGCFGLELPVPFELSPLVIGVLSSLLGTHIVSRTVEKLNDAD